MLGLAAGVFLFPAAVHAQDSTTVVPAGEAFLEQLQPRDSVLVADQLEYGFELQGVEEGTGFMFPDYSKGFCPGVEIVSPWTLDTLDVHKGRRKAPSKLDIRGSVTITSFDEGKYELPPVYIVRISPDGVADTLAFAPKVLDVRTMPVDTASFQIHDIKGQIQYPVEFCEVFPYLAGAVVLLLVILAALYFTGKYFRKKSGAEAAREPAHIRALKKLDKFRGDSFWAPEKQKTFYSGVTDALREYIVSRYGVSAMEMTTKEIFDSLKDKDIRPDLYEEARDLFERADYVKFAKYVASQQENASAVPSAVKFVTMTYQEELDAESAAAPSDGQQQDMDGKPLTGKEEE